MGFDLTGLNPKNKKYKSPSNDLYEKDTLEIMFGGGDL